MSWRVANECAERRFGSAVRKQIIMFLADKASDDGSGIWCSKGTIQRHTELGESTVKRTINEFLAEGLLVETGRRKCKNGYTIVYRIILAAVARLERIHEPDFDTGSTADPVHSEPGTGSTEGGVGGSRWTPNHPKTIHKPPTRGRAKAATKISEIAQRVLDAYPPDRLRDRETTSRLVDEAIAEGTVPDELIAAAALYAQETIGFTRDKVCFSDNWLKTQRWRAQIDRVTAEKAEKRKQSADGLAVAFGWIQSRSALCRHISPRQANQMLA